MRNVRRGLFVASVILVVLASPRRSAHAQSATDIEARRALLSQAQQAHDANDHAHALEYAQRAGQIEMTPSLRLFIAQEHAALSQPADALGHADACVREAGQSATIPNREAILAECRHLQEELAHRVGRVTVSAPSPAPDGLRVTIGGTNLNSAFYGTPYPVNPGDVSIEADAPGHGHFARTVHVEPDANVDVAVDLPVVASSAPASSASPVEATPTPRPIPVAPIVVAGVGVVAFAVAAGVFFGVREPASQALTTACPDPTMCADNPTNRSNYDSLQSGSIATDVLLGVGVVAVAAGVAWFAVDRFSQHAEHPHAAWYVAPSPQGIVVGGSL